MKAKKYFTFVILIIVALFLVACGNANNELVGRWNGENTNITMDIFSDGGFAQNSPAWSFAGTWSAEGDRLLVSGFTGGLSGSWDFSISNDTLTLSRTGSMTHIFTREN